jgi:hypothetical protein
MIEALPDDALEAALKSLCTQERHMLADFLRHLAEFDRRQLAISRAFASLFEYCTKALKLSEDQAYKRIQAARCAMKHPRIYELIKCGDVNLTSVVRLAPHRDEKAFGTILESARGKSTWELETFLSSLGLLKESAGSKIRIVGTNEVQITIVAPLDMLNKLNRATDLSRHRRPQGKVEEIIDDALEALLDRLDRDRKARPSSNRPVAPGGRHIPEWVKDEVWKRDGGRCTFTLDGERCGSESFVQYDHVIPFARGGRSDDPGNVRLFCGAHNRKAAADMGLGWSGKA